MRETSIRSRNFSKSHTLMSLFGVAVYRNITLSHTSPDERDLDKSYTLVLLFYVAFQNSITNL
jgi:hypothetical protein